MIKWLALLLFVPLVAFGGTLSQQQQRDYHALLQETRCITCLNQNLSESSAPIAVSMREEILRRIENGEDKHQVRAYLVESYGEFVSFRPSFSLQNSLLWGLPAMFVLGAVFLVIRRIKFTNG